MNNRTLVAAFAVAMLALTAVPTGHSALFQRADHQQDCYLDDGNVTTEINAGSTYYLCMHAGIVTLVGVVNLIDVDFFVSQPTGQTGVLVIPIAVLLHDGQATLRDTVTGGTDNGQVVDNQGANTFDNQVYLCPAGSAAVGCAAFANCDPSTWGVVSATQSNVLPGFGSNPMTYDLAVEPYFTGDFIDIVWPSQVTSLTQVVNVDGTAGCNGAYNVDTTLGTGDVFAIANVDGLVDRVTYTGVSL